MLCCSASRSARYARLHSSVAPEIRTHGRTGTGRQGTIRGNTEFDETVTVAALHDRDDASARVADLLLEWLLRGGIGRCETTPES
jgi:hypothetical protein